MIAHEQPERVIVFGSLATGDVHPWSDIDLVIVKPTSLPFWKRLRRVRQLLKPQVGTDILYYTQRSLRNSSRSAPSSARRSLAGER